MILSTLFNMLQFVYHVDVIVHFESKKMTGHQIHQIEMFNELYIDKPNEEIFQGCFGVVVCWKHIEFYSFKYFICF